MKPQLNHDDWIIKTISMTKDTEDKLEMLRAKYKVSRSALIRILVGNVE